MADRNRIRDIAISRYTVKIKADVDWPTTVAAFQGVTPAERQAFAAAIYGGDNPHDLAQRARDILDTYLANGATVAVDAVMVDDNFTLDEVEQIFL